MRHHPLRLFSILCSLSSACALAQQTTLDLSTEAAVGSGDFTPYYLTSNRHGILATTANTGYVRAAIDHQRPLSHDFSLDACADLQYQAHSDNPNFYIQQLYLKIDWRSIGLCVGSREMEPLVRDRSLSSGSMLWSGNARPIPGVWLGTNHFIDFPWTKGRLQFYLDGSYGYYMDSHYLDKEYDQYTAIKQPLVDQKLVGPSALGYKTTHVWSHIKRFGLRSNPKNHFVFTLDVEHSVLFGGKSVSYVQESNNGDFSPKFKDFFSVIIPFAGGSDAAWGDQRFFYGNHNGIYTFQADYQWGGAAKNQHCVGLYLENPFEDGSGLYKGNGWDGLWGLEYHNRQPHALVSGVLFEFLCTSDQSGSIHWDPKDLNIVYGPDFQSTGKAHGNDNYYNNYFFNSVAHFGQNCGSPMLKSPAYNADHYLNITDNRINAWHFGIEGELYHSSPLGENEDGFGLCYRLLTSYRNSYGTHYVPTPIIGHTFNLLTELSLRLPHWTITTALALDRGDLYGSNTAFDLRINRRFQL